MTSTRLLTVFVRRDRSACPSITARRVPVVRPENIEDVVDASVSRSTEPDDEDGADAEDEDAADRLEDSAENAGRDKGR